MDSHDAVFALDGALELDLLHCLKKRAWLQARMDDPKTTDYNKTAAAQVLGAETLLERNRLIRKLSTLQELFVL